MANAEAEPKGMHIGSHLNVPIPIRLRYLAEVFFATHDRKYILQYPTGLSTRSVEAP